jgi:predicted dehydrogenase
VAFASGIIVIRLAMCGLDEDSAAKVVARVRGAVLAPLDACDAAVVEGWPDCIGTAERLLLSGRHALVPAVACLKTAALDRLEAAAASGGVHLAIGNEERFRPSPLLIKDQIDAGKLGNPGLVRIIRWELEKSHDRFPDANWQFDIDLATWLVNRQPEIVYAISNADRQYGQVHIGFSGGAMAIVTYANCVLLGFRQLTVIGSRGAAYADDHLNHQLQLQSMDTTAHPTGYGENWRESKTGIVQHFIDGLSGKHDLPASVRQWRKSLELAEAVLQSLDTRQAVRIGGSAQ